MASKRRDGDRAAEDRRHRSNQQFAKRHPEKAREERGLRKSHARLARWGNYREATPETLEKASHAHQGALARLFVAGHITIDQLAAGDAIRVVHERLGRDASIGTVSLETRVDNGRSGDGGFFEKLGAVRSEVAYTRWRAWLGPTVWPVLAMVADDVAYSAAAKRWHMSNASARRLLSGALDAWRDFIGEACDEIDEATLLAAHAGILG